MNPDRLLRLEGLTVFAAATGAFVVLGGPLWLYLVVALAPDLGMLGYLAGPRVGSYSYNALHVYAGPALLGGLGLWTGVDVAVLVALVWAAHVGVDRSLGYGLKYPTGFGDTHLGRVGRRRTAGDGEAPDADPTLAK